MQNCFAQGMVYLYKTQMPHGHLRLKHCLVTHRWQVKITGFGLHSQRAFRALKASFGRKYQGKSCESPADFRTMRWALKDPQGKQNWEMISLSLTFPIHPPFFFS